MGGGCRGDTMSKELSLDFESFHLGSGQMIIWEAALRSLEEQLTLLEHRAEYYGEHTFSKVAFLEVIADLKSRARQIRRTNQGEA